jgi:hypothetical protein
VSDNEFAGCTFGVLVWGVGGMVGDPYGGLIQLLAALMALAFVEGRATNND